MLISLSVLLLLPHAQQVHEKHAATIRAGEWLAAAADTYIRFARGSRGAEGGALVCRARIEELCRVQNECIGAVKMKQTRQSQHWCVHGQTIA